MMHLFADYIAPLITWLRVHPELALVITFLIAFAESLAIIGSIIPGSVTMTTIGILAGSGVMRVDLTFTAATLGAIAGDGISYLVGYKYSDRLSGIWPFRNYPSWLTYGKEYFAKHGGKSVVIGRFVGPLRSIIPVIAGMMHMTHLRFFAANAFSAILWSLLYLMPGVLIGAASTELSPESATKLFLSIILLLFAFWLFSMVIKHIIVRLNLFLKRNLHQLWSSSIQHPTLTKVFAFLTPENEQHFYPTAGLFLSILLLIISFIGLTFMNHNEQVNMTINQSVYLFLQSLRTIQVDYFFIVLNDFYSPLNLLVMFFFVSMCLIWQRAWRNLLFWVMLHVLCCVVFSIAEKLNYASPFGLFNFQFENIENVTLSFFISQYLSLILYFRRYSTCQFNQLLTSCLASLILLVSISPLYLGDILLIDVAIAYVTASLISLSCWLFYRRQQPIKQQGCRHIWIVVALLCSTLLSLQVNLKQSLLTHHQYQIHYIIDKNTWWQQQEPLLPLYRTNRIGKNIALFNVQYAGSIMHLEKALEAQGWKKYQETVFISLLTRFNNIHKKQDLPLMAPLYLNKKPILVMIYYDKQQQPLAILRLWWSSFYLSPDQVPISIGSVNVYNFSRSNHQLNQQGMLNANVYFSDALKAFQLRHMNVNENLPSTLLLPFKPEVILVKE